MSIDIASWTNVGNVFDAQEAMWRKTANKYMGGFSYFTLLLTVFQMKTYV